MALVTGLELAWWGVTWSLGVTSAPWVGTYLLIAFSALASAVGLRFLLGRRGPGTDAIAVLAGTMLTAIGASAFLPLKYAIPRIIPFWLDTPLAVAELQWFGEDPWRLLDRLLGWATPALDWIYGTWLPVQLLVMFSAVIARPSAAKSRALIAYSIGWFLLGVVAALLFSSAGPIFYDRLYGDSHFVGLGDMLRARGATIALAESDAMWRSWAAGEPGFVAGMSAVPSLHVAISLWMFLAARTMAPRAAIPAFLYLALIWLGSIQLGWHYASDGLFGVLGMIMVWKLAGAVQGCLELRRHSGSHC